VAKTLVRAVKSSYTLKVTAADSDPNEPKTGTVTVVVTVGSGSASISGKLYTAMFAAVTLYALM